MADPYYITTAISYPNGAPHIGHAYEAIAADVIARFHKAQGRDVRFQTGTDEHGLKMAQAARAEGVDPAVYAENMSAKFKAMCDALDVDYDRFIRTSEPDHHRASQAIWRAMEANGDLYLGRYEGWYSVRDEAFYDESELIEGEGTKLSPQGAPVEWTVEESWFFKLSAYQQPLLDHYAAHPEFIQPDSRRNEVLRFVEGGLNDLSISRTSFDWGVKVPGDDGLHVMYVWLDALTNYLTGLGYPDGGELFDRYWPPNVHLIGKDVVRFHAVYWPAFLMSAGIALPKQVYGHGFLLSRGEKMSKSVGNVVDPLDLAARYGVDALRYFLLREVTFGQDGSYSHEAIVNRVNAELANSFGNLAQRSLSMIFKNLNGVIPAVGDADEDRELLETVRTACHETLPAEFERFAFAAGLEAWMAAVYACNAYVDTTAPWALKKSDSDRMAAVLGTLAVAARQLALAVAPIIPGSAAKLIALIDSGEGGQPIAQPTPIFPRLELEEADPT